MTATGSTNGPAVTDLVVMTEAEFASMRSAEGATVIERDGRFWGQTFTGFFQPIHQLARHRVADVRRPTLRCWGYRSALVAEEADRANGAIPVHLMTDFQGFTEAAFDESRRRDVRRCRREVEILRVRDPSLLVGGGWEVYKSAKERVPQGGTLTESEYRVQIEQRASDERRLHVAALIDGVLVGYMESYAVDGILYGRDLYVASDAMKLGTATGLYLETMRIGALAGSVDTFCLGPVLLERPGLAWFKIGLGVGIVHVPARVSIPAPISAFIKRTRPAVYYRLTGDRPPKLEGIDVRGSNGRSAA